MPKQSLYPGVCVRLGSSNLFSFQARSIQRSLFLFSAGIFCASASFAQTVPSAIPVPSGPPAQVPAEPAYGTQPTSTSSAPVATPAPPPAVLPNQPNPPSAPYSAFNAYGPASTQAAYKPYGVPDEDKPHHAFGSAYIPMDSWIYPAMSRLYSLGYGDTQFASMRPWTRQSVTHMLDESEDDVREGNSEEAQQILLSVRRQLTEEVAATNNGDRGTVYGTETLYDRAMVISGTPLRDSYHLGQTIVNDYGRPYQNGFNNLLGFSAIAERGRFSLYIRGEYQHAPSADGYSSNLAQILSISDQIPYSGYNLNQATVPAGPIAAANPFRLQEASLSFYIAGHEVSGGKTDSWLGPAQGGSLAWSNNAENIYSFRINRVEPLRIPLLSRLLGPVRYDFFYGSLKGHTDPNHPYVHSEMFAFKPTVNFEFSFQRTVIFGGAGHEPITLHTFLRSFFSINDTTANEKSSALDPGARFSSFTVNYRLPFVRKYATFYVDSLVHDDVTPISAPRRAAIRTGLYLSHLPGIPRLDLRAEGAFTDPRVTRSIGGTFIYDEGIQLQGYTNKGFILGDWMGREAKGGQAWLTYHISGNQWIQAEYLNKKNDKDFPGQYVPALNVYLNSGTTQNQFKVDVVKRFMHDNLELDGSFQFERWKAPLYKTGAQNDTVTAVKLTFYPGLKHIGAS